MSRLMTAAAVLFAAVISVVPIDAEGPAGAGRSSANAREPFRYAYIARNVSCTVNGRMTRHVYVSQVFGYCEAEVTKGQLLRDTTYEFRQVAGAACEGNADVTFEFVNGPHRAEADAEVERDRAMTSRDYSKHVAWFASVDYPSTQCR